MDTVTSKSRFYTTNDQTTKYKQPVDDEVLKTKNVQQPDRPARDVTLAGRWPVYSGVDFIHNPDKQPPVDPLEDKTYLSLQTF